MALAAPAAAAALAAEPSAVPPEAEPVREEYQPPAARPRMRRRSRAPSRGRYRCPRRNRSPCSRPPRARDLDQSQAHGPSPRRPSGLEPEPHHPGAEYYATRAEPFPEPYTPGRRAWRAVPAADPGGRCLRGARPGGGPRAERRGREPGRTTPRAPAPSPPGTRSGPARASELIEGVYCQNGHFNDPDARECAVCGIGLEPAGQPAAGHAAAARRDHPRRRLGVPARHGLRHRP